MSHPSPELARIQRGRLCTGCGLCRAIAGPEAIEIALDGDGYLRPNPIGPINFETDRLIGRMCPGRRLDYRAEDDAAQGRGPFHPDWGPLRRVATAHAVDPDLRFRGASGGALSATLAYLLDSGAVDFVVQTAVSPLLPLQNATQISFDVGDVARAAGSRYAPSAPLADLREQLARPGRFAFVGKPCDVAALRAYARHDPRVDEKVAVVISFMCGGIPSQLGTEELVVRFDMEPARISSFRYRGNGWPGSATAIDAEGREASMSYVDSWGGVLSKRVQFRCKICPDGVGMFADLTFADAWYGDERGYPTFDERPGRSMVLARTARGEGVLADAEGAGALEIQPLAEGEIVRMQPYQARRRRLALSRFAALVVLGQAVPRVRGLRLFTVARMAGSLANAKSFFGLCRRVVLGRR